MVAAATQGGKGRPPAEAEAVPKTAKSWQRSGAGGGTSGALDEVGNDGGDRWRRRKGRRRREYGWADFAGRSSQSRRGSGGGGGDGECVAISPRENQPSLGAIAEVMATAAAAEGSVAEAEGSSSAMVLGLSREIQPRAAAVAAAVAAPIVAAVIAVVGASAAAMAAGFAT
eukprot:g9862.t1